MARDILADLGYLALGSRLKRLADRFVTDAAAIHEESGYGIQQSHFGLLAAIDRYGPLTVMEAAKTLGVSQPGITRTLSALVDADILQTVTSETDGRQKAMHLTEKGQRILLKLKTELWPRVEAAAREICQATPKDVLETITELEEALSECSLLQRVRDRDCTLKLVEYSEKHRDLFRDINLAWIETMFEVEQGDLDQLEHPRSKIIEKGGEILFVEAADLGIVGTVALIPAEEGWIELSKMGVREEARGRMAGDFLMRALLICAQQKGVLDKMFLLTNKKCEAAISLYEKYGFEHDAYIMDRFGKNYSRCDVAMKLNPDIAITRLNAFTARSANWPSQAQPV